MICMLPAPQHSPNSPSEAPVEARIDDWIKTGMCITKPRGRHE